MASFGLFPSDDTASMAAGLMNATAPAAAAAADAVHRAAHVSAGAVNFVRGAGNVFSLVALLIPLWTYVKPVYQAKGVGDRTIYTFIGVFLGATLWLLYAIPSEHRDVFTMVVNCTAIGMQAFYIFIYLKYVGEENFIYSIGVVLVGGTMALGLVIFVVSVVFLSHTWRLKIVGITASTFGTAMFVVGVIDVVNLLKNQRSPFSMLQLSFNLVAACIWTSFAFMFDPVNDYVVVPNLTGVAVIIAQIIVHAMLKWKEHNNQPAPLAGNNRA